MSVVRLIRAEADPLAGGFYTVREAARLLNIRNPQKITAWLKGRGGGGTPVIRRQYPPIERVQELGFWDLLEARFVNHFREQGVSLQALRKAAETARAEFNQDHPFATSNVKFLTDRREVFLKTAKDLKDAQLLNLVTKQFAMYEVLEEVLAKGVEFDPVSGLAARWTPKPKEFPEIVVDPLVAYGQPALDRVGVPTDVLYTAWRAEDGDLRKVADWYEVDEDLVRQAVEFEIGLSP